MIVEDIRKLQAEWALRPEQVRALLRVDEPQWNELFGPGKSGDESGATVPPGWEAAPALIAIHRRLAARYPEPDDQVKWLFTGHPEFGGHKPIDVAASSLNNLMWVAYTLDSPREN